MRATPLPPTPRHRASTRVAAYLLACVTTWASWIPLVQAQSTDIADVPMATQGRVKPNLIFVVDDSGSMDFEVLGAKFDPNDATLPPNYNMSTNDGSIWWNTASRSFIGWGTNASIADPMNPVAPSQDIWRGGGTAPVGDITSTAITWPPIQPDPVTGLPPLPAEPQLANSGFSSQLSSTHFSDPSLPRGPFNFNFGGLGASDAFFRPDIAAGAPNLGRFKKFQILFPNGTCGATCDQRSDNDSSANGSGFVIPPTREFAYTRSPRYNAQYYNPEINYEPWRPYNDGTTTFVPPNYDNSGAGRPWTAVRSHPVFPTPTTTNELHDLTIDRPVPGDANINGRHFRFYPGMILPAGARWQSCRAGDAGCSAWVDNTLDRCIVPEHVGLNNATTRVPLSAPLEYCPFAQAYGVLDTLELKMGPRPEYARVAGQATGLWSRVYLRVQMPFREATVWILNNDGLPLQADEAWAPDGKKLRRVVIDSATTSYAKGPNRTDCLGATCSYAEEMTNFANWFAYYRKRFMMAYAALGLSFDQVSGLRGGFFFFGDRRNVTMFDFDNTDNRFNGRRLLNDIYRGKFPRGTPTREALEYAGNQFRRTDANAPINAACQYNAAFVITDGFATNTGPTGYGNADAADSNRFTIPYSTTNPDLNYTNAEPAGNLPLPTASLTLPAVTVTPAAPITDAYSNTMADIAMRFYSTTLRTDGTYAANARLVPVDVSDTGPDADRNDFLHMATFALGLGTQGLFYDVDAGRTANPYDATLPFTWPDPRGGTANFLQRSPVAVDELWHATINGRGLMLSARSPEETRSAMVDVVNSVAARAGAGAAVAVANPNLAPGDNFSYASSYNSGAWSGDLNKFAINLSTGIPETTPQWVSPQQQLAVRQPANRLIATFNTATSVGVEFAYSNLSGAQQNLLTSDTTLGNQMVDFLRGDRTFEVEKFKSRGSRPLRNTTTGAYILDGSNYTYLNGIVPRNISVLGDIINSEPVIVRDPLFNYFDAGYAAYRSAQAGRLGVVYQGANDGMLHAFNINTGAELWAYIPGLVYPTLRNLTDKNAFRHLYYVDGTPTVGDVDFSVMLPNDLSSPPAPVWQTILVSGLRKGGRGYFALNVTNGGSAGTQAEVAAKAMWEFPAATTPNPGNVGWTFGKPVIVKTRAAGWVVLVTSGYNNGTGAGQSGGDGRGYLYVLNPRTGAVIATLTTGVGTTTTPSGLAQISAFVDRPSTDPTVEAVYGGDLLGNLWRFDLSSTSTAAWSVTLLAQLRDASNNPQPITTEPELGVVARKRVVFVGTGQYLGDTDVLNNTPENAVARRRMSFYAIKDEGSTAAGPVVHPSSTLRSQLTQQTVTKTSTTIDITNNATNFATQAGWFIDLPDVGERSNTNPALVNGVLAFTTNLPDRSDPCRPGGSSWLYFVDYATGGRVVGATSAGVKIGNVLASRVVIVATPGVPGSDTTASVPGKTVGIVRTSDAANTGTQLPTGTAGLGGRRMSWREIPDEAAP